jgi:hypothetical protein
MSGLLLAILVSVALWAVLALIVWAIFTAVNT